MKAGVERVHRAFWAHVEHPYRHLSKIVESRAERARTILDAGCGYEAPMLRRLRGRGKTLIGVDLVEFTASDEELVLVRSDLAALPLRSETVDLAYSRSVLEHVVAPEAVFAELSRVLAPGGALVILTPNKWDYASVISRIVPNRYHGPLVKLTTGRDPDDVFPTVYKANSKKDLYRHLRAAGLEVREFRYLGQYPEYLKFSSILYFLGSLYEKMLIALPILRRLRGWILLVAVKDPA